MYLKIQKITKKEHKYGFDTIINGIGLYKDDGKHIKFIKHADKIIDKLLETKIDITIPELDGLLTDQDLDKIIPPREPNLFDAFIPCTPQSDTKSVSKNSKSLSK